MNVELTRQLHAKFIELENEYLKAEEEFYTARGGWDENKYNKMYKLKKEKDEAYEKYEMHRDFER